MLIMTDSNNYSDWYSWIEKRVCVKNDLFGTLKYFGNTHFSDGLWCGIELDNQLGKNDGMVNNVRYFTCKSNFGIFIHVSKVTKIEDFPDNFQNIANLNETFKIENSLEKQEVESNSVESETMEEKLHNSLLGSTESLGILSLDLIECDSWEDIKLNCSLNDEFPNPQNMIKSSSYSFLEPAAVSEKDLTNTIANPKYSSTPRVPKKKLVDYENDSDDSLDAKNHLIDKFAYDIHSEKTSEFFFDVDKLKNNPNLTSTCKNLSEITSILNSPELSPLLLGNKNMQGTENLDFLKDRFSQNSNEILSKTFELHNSTNSPIEIKEYEKVLNNKNELNVTTVIEDLKSIKPEDMKPNANITFELNECEQITVTDKNALLLGKTFVFDLSIINENEDSKIQNESFKYKEKFLNEVDLLQNSSTCLNYRNSTCAPLKFCNKFQNSTRRSSSVSSYPCREKEKCLKEVTTHKSFNNGGSTSNLKDLHEKNKFLKTPFNPNSTLRNSKTVLKSHYSISSKENKNKTLNKESSKLPKNTLSKNTNNKATINKDCEKSEINVKSQQIKPFNKETSEFSLLKMCNSKNSSSKTESNVAVPLKNTLNYQNPKKSSNIPSKFCSKTMPINKNGIQTFAVVKIVQGDLIKDDVAKNLKMPNLDSTFISKAANGNVSQISNFPASNVSNNIRIPKRNSLVPGFKDKLPVGIIKPRYSICQPKNAVLENGEIGKNKSSQTSKVTEKDLNEMNLHTNDEINNSLKECSIPMNSSKKNSNIRQLFNGLPKNIKNPVISASHKSGLKEPLKRGRISTSLKIPVFRKS